MQRKTCPGVREECPKGYGKDELRDLAKSCGVNITRPGGKGYKTMNELCQEIKSKQTTPSTTTPSTTTPSTTTPSTTTPSTTTALPRSKFQEKLAAMKAQREKAKESEQKAEVKVPTLEDVDELEEKKYRDLNTLLSFLKQFQQFIFQSGQGDILDAILRAHRKPSSEVRRSQAQDFLYNLVADISSQESEESEEVFVPESEEESESVSSGEATSEEGPPPEEPSEEEEYVTSSEESDDDLAGRFSGLQISPPEKEEHQRPTWDDISVLDLPQYNNKAELEKFIAVFIPLLVAEGYEPRLRQYLKEYKGDFLREQVQSLLAMFVPEGDISQESEDSEEESTREEPALESGEEEEASFEEEELEEDSSSGEESEDSFIASGEEEEPTMAGSEEEEF